MVSWRGKGSDVSTVSYLRGIRPSHTVSNSQSALATGHSTGGGKGQPAAVHMKRPRVTLRLTWAYAACITSVRSSTCIAIRSEVSALEVALCDEVCAVR